ncbi:50S ribosomal protein L7/L12 [Candidatus Uhrbacteria bacterium]|nr:50S ribosomal protein L7/L12 [Candidatus Uhrbacteria bacterium]
MADDQKVEVPEKFQGIVTAIEQLNVLDLAELVKVLEAKFGVSAAAPVAMMAAPAAGGAAAEAAEEQSAFSVELTAAGDKKIDVIKAIRALSDIGLKDAKDLVDGAPKMIKEGVPKAQAQEWKKKLEEAGAKVTLK